MLLKQLGWFQKRIKNEFREMEGDKKIVQIEKKNLQCFSLSNITIYLNKIPVFR